MELAGPDRRSAHGCLLGARHAPGAAHTPPYWALGQFFSARAAGTNPAITVASGRRTLDYPAADRFVWSPMDGDDPSVDLAAGGLAAFVATLVCWAKMGNAWRMGIDPNDKTQLVCTGPYAYIRHPIYALSSLLMLMTMLILPSPAMLMIGVVHLLLLQWEARREEEHLLASHGEEYRVYRARTGRFLPRFFACDSTSSNV